jgi:hypothetical protein
MGGFRKVGRKQQTKYVVLYSSQSDRNWPDQLDLATGLFTYFGDNKTPGSRLHETTRGGDKLLARVFDQIHAADIVAQRYKDAQRRMLGKKPRAVGQERLRLLGFVETMGKGMSWRERMDLWDKLAASSKKERYEDVRNFSKAYKQVRAMVLGARYVAAKRDEPAAREARRRRIAHALARPHEQ